MSLVPPSYLLASVALVGLVLAGCRAAPDERAVGSAPVAEATYAGDEACASCHADLYASYHRTGMGRSVSRFDPATAPERFGEGERGPTVYNARFDLYYEAFVRGDSLFQREFRLDERGEVTHELVYPADYVVGSGNATRSYFMRRNDFVTEMPLTWYVGRELWDMSPGYETSNSRFGRPATLECMTCHNGLPEHSPFTQNHYAELPLGITCERCHGPAAEHVEARLAGFETDGPDPAVVNPARLERTLQLSVCQQCHLEGIAVFKPGEDPTTFRPGEALAAHRSVFARLEQVEDEDAFGIASHGLRLAQSACFEASAMTCTTCHDPHQPTADFGADAFNETCRSCHGGDSSPHDVFCSRPATGSPATGSPAEALTGDCVSCHMQTGGTSDIPHVAFTDHWIRRELPPARPAGRLDRELVREEPLTLVNLLVSEQPREPGVADLEAGLAYFHLYETLHRIPDYLPDVAARLRRGLAAGADHPEARLTLGRALLAMDSLAAAERVLGEAVAAHPDDAWAPYWLGEVRQRRGNVAAAEGPLRRAVEIQPLFVEARVALADVLAETGRTDEAVAQLETAVETNPEHATEAWNNLGFLHLQAGRADAARAPLERAVALDPDFAEARVNLGTAFLLAEELDAAVAQFEAATRARPDYAPAYGNLGVAYLQQGRTADARRMFERLLELTPTDQRARAYLQQLGPG